jgi:hypothetical protein
VWFGNWHRSEAGAGFGGASAAPIFQQFMSQALVGQPDLGLPAAGPVCARPGSNINPLGGHDAAPPVFVPTPQVPTVQQQPTVPTPTAPPAPTTPAVTIPGNRGNGNGKQ